MNFYLEGEKKSQDVTKVFKSHPVPKYYKIQKDTHGSYINELSDTPPYYWVFFPMLSFAFLLDVLLL